MEKSWRRAGERRWAAAFRAALAAQRDRWILWLPVGVIAGAALWFTAPGDPPGWIAPATFLAAAALATLTSMWPGGSVHGVLAWLRAGTAGVLSLAAALALGAACAHARTALAAAPRLEREIGPVAVTGWVEEAQGGARVRLLLLVRTIEGVAAPPRFVRMATSGRFTAGRAVRCYGILQPPDGPLAPGAYDFARRAYFARIGATGFTYGACRPIELGAPDAWFDRARLKLAAVRSDLSEAIYAAAPGRGAAVAVSLVTGDRSLIEEETDAALRDSGLGHILSVSGLHMGVVGGLMFALLSGLFALIPPLALRLPVRKLAAAGALVTLTLYLLISGASVPAIRAYVMAAVAFGAVLIDRPAITMRGLALAATIIVLVLPDSVLEPGFQMSFAATAALVAAFETRPATDWERRLPSPGPIVGGMQAFSRMLLGALAVSFVAGLAVDPFALYHFQRFAVYGLPANLVASPLVAFVIAPAAVAAAVAAPFGFADVPLGIMARACELLVGIGASFAERPEAVRALPKPPDAAFVLAVSGVLWACVWRGGMKAAGAVIFAGGVLVYAFAARPVLWFDGELRAVFVRGAEGWTLTRAYGRSIFARERLGQMAGLAPAESAALAAPEMCSEAACIALTPRGGRIVTVLTREGFAAVREGDVVLTRLDASENLRGAIDAGDLARRSGGYGIETERGLVLTRARGETRRAWDSLTVAPPAPRSSSPSATLPSVRGAAPPPAASRPPPP
ncbi:MAG: ComEC/Rec2 family competence protein [Hyphomonadaceae bacterium]|nr:ComEC/Rec2 family competence protein [Hyphomonadaceae bacterium]